jgi:hypothetical protein
MACPHGLFELGAKRLFTVRCHVCAGDGAGAAVYGDGNRWLNGIIGPGAGNSGPCQADEGDDSEMVHGYPRVKKFMVRKAPAKVNRFGRRRKFRRTTETAISDE